MAEAKTSLKTPPCILGPWPKVFEQGLPDDNGVRYYEFDLLFSPEAQQTAEYAALKAAVVATAKKKWPDGTPEGSRNPLRKASAKKRQADGSSHYPEAQFPGWTFMHVKSKNKPGVVDAQVREITDESEIYGGCTVRVSVGPYAYQKKGNVGVAFGLNNLQKLKDGDPIGGAKSRPEDDFAPVGDVSGEDIDAMFAE